MEQAIEIIEFFLQSNKFISIESIVSILEDNKIDITKEQIYMHALLGRIQLSVEFNVNQLGVIILNEEISGGENENEIHRLSEKIYTLPVKGFTKIFLEENVESKYKIKKPINYIKGWLYIEDKSKNVFQLVYDYSYQLMDSCRDANTFGSFLINKKYARMRQLPSGSSIGIRAEDFTKFAEIFNLNNEKKTKEENNCNNSDKKEPQDSDLSKKISMVLNDKHPWHSKDLALAVETWLELYSGRKGNKDDNKYKPLGGNAEFIENHLKSKRKEITKERLKHLHVIINPSKQGGPKKISK